MVHMVAAAHLAAAAAVVAPAEKGDALQAAEIALSLEKLNFAKLRQLHSLADDADDADMSHCERDNGLSSAHSWEKVHQGYPLVHAVCYLACYFLLLYSMHGIVAFHSI